MSRLSVARSTALITLPLVALATLLLSTLAHASGEQKAPLATVPKALPGAPPLPGELRARLAAELAGRGAQYRPRTKNLHPDGRPIFTNRLLLEASPYLQQHAHNPVDWYPWGDEAFAAAKRLGRPILVSIGYSTCHWCHVMEEETFDVEEHVRFLNEHFIAIKVDREARPDVDSIYMSAVHAMNQRGGWPLNVWLLPSGEPFYGGTYFPPEDRPGRPGFGTVIRALHARYSENGDRLEATAQRLARQLKATLERAPATSSRIPGPELIDRAARLHAEGFDDEWGGVGDGNKFPASLPIRLLLRHHRRSGDATSLAMATLTLERMAAGGIHDPIGGGFHRYATDRRWRVPHFEKMLYDNARLAIAYLEAGQITRRPDFNRVVTTTLDYVAREMTAPNGGFYSATDADSANPRGESEEGWFFTWTPAEMRAALGPELAKLAIAKYGVTEAGNFEGRNILYDARASADIASEFGLTAPALERAFADARKTLYATRAKRPAPLRDDKILVAWNGLMISAFARAGFVFNEPRHIASAQRAADYILREMRVDSRLQRLSLDGRVSGTAFLEDYAFLIQALLDLYEADPNERWLREALALQSVLDTHYGDPGGGYYRSANDGDALLAREKPARDGALPSGNSIAALNLLRLAEFTSDDAHNDAAMLLFSAFYETLEGSPTALAEMLIALDFHHLPTQEIVIVRPESGGEVEPMLETLRATLPESRILSVVHQGDELDRHAELIPLLQGKRALGGRVTAYACQNRVCAYPTSDPKEFARQLREAQARMKAADGRDGGEGLGRDAAGGQRAGSKGRP